MNDREFNDLVDGVLSSIEDVIDDAECDIDIESSAGVLTLTLVNGSKVIINRQAATHEIWVAARSGGYHCAWRDSQWCCTATNETLGTLLARVLAEQGATGLSFA
ncbi:MAG: iron donor protein CyaY [Moraxellaceae bacterium]|nr:iron donor protein CyaY [Moraxellaceae bacterium]MDP1775977.1 iron donor protein CyaY [Moraxellaceae bacterium]MDZ4297375.1 iron donor protein CyaY [Moraxellaceae bacterium]MDZ4386603.1 iron donor protein CyaY [Moraxellaceae bacterium]